jgi:3-oxoacyl-[acyl-carrier protein] reductase
MLTGRKAIVTGGSRGIGRAVVERLVRDGAEVAFSYATNASAADNVVSAVKAKGGTAHATQADFGQLDDIRRLFAQAEELLGGLDIAVLNAAIVEGGTVEQVDEATYDLVMDVNAKGTFFALQEAARRLRDGGRIVTVSTLNTVRPFPGNAIYTASKAAVEQFAAIAAKELAARGITVNTVSPGATDTDMLRGANPPEVLDLMVTMTPLKRLGTPADVADVIAFLVGPDGRWMTGQNLHAGGGLA